MMTFKMYAVFFLGVCSCDAVDVQHLAAHSHSHDKKLSAASSFPKANLTALAITSLAQDCKCKFHGVCSCEQTMEFMNCIADACDSEKCDCSGNHFLTACQAMGTTCPKAGLVCSAGKASCPASGAVVEMDTIADVMGDLEVLRQRKCELEEAVKKGFLNGKPRLEELQPEINERLSVLKTKSGGKTLNMGCAEKDLADFDAGREKILEEVAASVPAPAPAAVAAPAPVAPASAPVAKAMSTPEVAELTPKGSASPTAMQGGLGGYYKHYFWELLKADAVYIIFAIVAAFLYNKYRHKEVHLLKPQRTPGWNRKDTKGFGRNNGLFSCFRDPKLFAFACCCPAIRWADTVDRAGLSELFKYWGAFFSMLLLLIISDHTFGAAYLCFAALGVVFRQRLRGKYSIESRNARTIGLDFLAWFCCAPCAIAQEAREEHNQSIIEAVP